MVPPIHRLPAAPILQVSAIAVRCATNHDQCDPAMWLLLMKLTNSLFYWLFFCAAAQRARWLKVSFWSDSSCFFHVQWLNTTRDVTIIDETNKFFNLLTIILCAAAQRARWLKVSFWSDSSCFFHVRWFNMMCADPGYLLEEFVSPPEFVLISTIVLIGLVRLNWCLWGTLSYYFRFLFVTHENHGVEIRGNLLTDILLSHVFNAGMPLRPVCHYDQYAITANTPLRPIHANTPLRPIRANTPLQPTRANTPLRPIRANMPIRANTPLRPIRYYGLYAITAYSIT